MFKIKAATTNERVPDARVACFATRRSPVSVGRARRRRPLTANGGPCRPRPRPRAIGDLARSLSSSVLYCCTGLDFLHPRPLLSVGARSFEKERVGAFILKKKSSCACPERAGRCTVSSLVMTRRCWGDSGPPRWRAQVRVQCGGRRRRRGDRAASAAAPPRPPAPPASPAAAAAASRAPPRPLSARPGLKVRPRRPLLKHPKTRFRTASDDCEGVILQWGAHDGSREGWRRGRCSSTVERERRGVWEARRRMMHKVAADAPRTGRANGVKGNADEKQKQRNT